jgi:8-oxo-dGTP diphosphatase
MPAVPHAPAGAAHWLMFCFEVLPKLDFPTRQIEEGRLEWIAPEAVAALAIPETDRQVIWPLVRQYSRHLTPRNPTSEKEGFFSVHIDCTDDTHFVVTHEHPRNDVQK